LVRPRHHTSKQRPRRIPSLLIDQSSIHWNPSAEA
jgi:hypothetical protein